MTKRDPTGKWFCSYCNREHCNSVEQYVYTGGGMSNETWFVMPLRAVVCYEGYMYYKLKEASGRNK